MGELLDLGCVLADSERLSEAEACFRRASDLGSPEGAFNLGNSLAAQERWLDAVAAFKLALDPSLEASLRAGADHFPAARADLGDLLVATGRVDEARQVFERGMKLGESESMLPLGNLYTDLLGDDDAAEVAYRAGAELGDAHSHHNLAVLLESQDDLEGAERHYRLAIEGGDTLAIAALRELLND